ncbi:hypothetical protein GCM10009118_15980 [Wandonia haliotis]|uniref:Uncharacterized protein n=1 Tax=Wandonia haliotis TaxID=574963 RepID=A0ABN1MPG9_9FLAO
MLKYRVYLENYWETQFDEFNYVDYSQHFTEDKPCNIYMVGIRPRVMIDPRSFEVINSTAIMLTFIIQYDLKEYDEKRIEVKLPREISGTANLVSNKPYSRFQITDNKGDIFEDIELLGDSGIHAKAFYVLRNNLSDEDEIAEINDLEVVYIGQSLKMDKTLSAMKRLGHHQKAQKVLERCNREFIYNEVYILLCSFIQKVDLITDSEELTKVDGQDKLFKAIEESKSLEDETKFRTDIAEASLIDYFDTKDFNSDFIGSFGRKTHKYYKKLILSSISEVTLEVDLTKLCYMYSQTINRKNYHSVSYAPHSNFQKTILK